MSFIVLVLNFFILEVSGLLVVLDLCFKYFFSLVVLVEKEFLTVIVVFWEVGLDWFGLGYMFNGM